MSMHKEIQVNLIVFFFPVALLKSQILNLLYIFLYEYKLNFNLVIYIVFVKVKKENYENYLKIKQVNFCSSKYMKFKHLSYEFLCILLKICT